MPLSRPTSSRKHALRLVAFMNARTGYIDTLFNVSDSEKVGAAPITTSTNTSIHQSQNEKDDPNILQVPPSSSAMSPTGSMSLLNSIESNESIWSWKSQSK